MEIVKAELGHEVLLVIVCMFPPNHVVSAEGEGLVRARYGTLSSGLLLQCRMRKWNWMEVRGQEKRRGQ